MTKYGVFRLGGIIIPHYRIAQSVLSWISPDMINLKLNKNTIFCYQHLTLNKMTRIIKLLTNQHRTGIDALNWSALLAEIESG